MRSLKCSGAGREGGTKGEGAKWVKAKYFWSTPTQNWVFSGNVSGKAGSIQTVRLLQAAATPIVRHCKIQGDANPYDPEWEPYFEHRLALNMAADLKKKRKLLYLWNEQNGLCPICTHKITQLTGWHCHHIVWKVLGGSDGAENRVLVHPTCHQQIHARPDLTVVKPRPARGVRKA